MTGAHALNIVFAAGVFVGVPAPILRCAMAGARELES